MACKMNSSLDLLHLAALAADRAGGYISSQSLRGGSALGAASGSLVWQSKGHHDWVSEVDRTAERIITKVLTEGAPGSTVTGEELNPSITRDGLVWIVDPLDGTTNFLHGYPQYAVSIAAAVNGVLEAGVILDVARECRYGAVRGQGAWMGSTRLSVSTTAEPARALLGTGYPFKQLEMLEEYIEQFRRVLPATSGVRRAGAAALDLADIAAGRLDGFWELTLAPWDFAAGLLLIREAGGIVTDLDGNPPALEPTGLVAGNPKIHAWLLQQVGAPGRQAALPTSPPSLQ